MKSNQADAKLGVTEEQDGKNSPSLSHMRLAKLEVVSLRA